MSSLLIYLDISMVRIIRSAVRHTYLSMMAMWCMIKYRLKTTSLRVMFFSQDEDEDIYTNIHDLRSKMEQISTAIGKEVTQVAQPDEAGILVGKMKMLDAEFREKQNQLQTLIEQRKAM